MEFEDKLISRGLPKRFASDLGAQGCRYESSRGVTGVLNMIARERPPFVARRRRRDTPSSAANAGVHRAPVRDPARQAQHQIMANETKNSRKMPDRMGQGGNDWGAQGWDVPSRIATRFRAGSTCQSPC